MILPELRKLGVRVVGLMTASVLKTRQNQLPRHRGLGFSVAIDCEEDRFPALEAPNAEIRQVVSWLGPTRDMHQLT